MGKDGLENLTHRVYKKGKKVKRKHLVTYLMILWKTELELGEVMRQIIADVLKADDT